MLSPRTLLFAFAAAGFAQNGPLTCGGQAATPTIRAEGVAELVGDIVIACNGGNPTPADRVAPQINIQIFTQPAINITSRVTTSGGNLIEFTEALLLIDEPSPENQRPCGSPDYPSSIPPATLQTVIAGVCGAHAGSPESNGVGVYDPNTETPVITGLDGRSYPTYRGNAYQARRAGNNSLLWQGVPFDPPGSLTSRIVRITNVRVNAARLVPPASVGMLISTNRGFFPQFGPTPPGIPLENPIFTVAIVQPGVDFRTTGPVICHQCESPNAEPLNGSRCDGPAFTLQFRERFPSAFRRRSEALPGSEGPDTSSDVPGTTSQTETGFYKAAPTAHWPARLQNGTIAAGPANGALGLADRGTLLEARFAAIPDGVEIRVPRSVSLVPDDRWESPRTGWAEFTGSAGDGLGAVTITGGSGQAAWEIVDTDTTALERVSIPVSLVYRGNPAAKLPGLGTASVSGGFGPVTAVLTASQDAPLPRFLDSSEPVPAFTIHPCRTSLLFPFVSNRSGFDTGLAIANTSKDPFGTSQQSGGCAVNFYGAFGDELAYLRYLSPSLAGGEHFVWTLSSGGAVPATPGFQGYLIAQCEFQYGHGFAFVTETGSRRLAMGYLGLILDDALPSRSGGATEGLRR